MRKQHKGKSKHAEIKEINIWKVTANREGTEKEGKKYVIGNEDINE